EERLEAVLEGVEAADPGRDSRADPLRLRGDVDPAVRLRHACRRERKLREAVHSSRLLAVDPGSGIEVLQLAREVDVVAGRVEVGNRAGAGLARDEARPAR